MAAFNVRHTTQKGGQQMKVTDMVVNTETGQTGIVVSIKGDQVEVEYQKPYLHIMTVPRNQLKLL